MGCIIMYKWYWHVLAELGHISLPFSRLTVQTKVKGGGGG